MAARAFVVGIDLGTTNSALAFARLLPGAGHGEKVHDFAIPQLVAPGSVARRPTLPSFLYLPAGPELPPGALALPWDAARAFAAGELARALGERVPARLVASAKSWLCHPSVDRTAAILPWGGAGDAAKLSPVDVSARTLAHLREAWDAELGAAHDAPLAEQEVVLTVPASFDAVARELTVEAAARAGLPRVTLLEEPQAAFYAWLDAHGAAPAGRLASGTQVLVCDIGGGTTDFTLIEARAGAGGGLELERRAVGDHLLLGGDNLDLALARLVEGRLAARGERLDPVQWLALVQQARAAKEGLLSDGGRESVPLAIPGRGSRIVGGTLREELSREDAMAAVLDGFFPVVEASANPGRTRGGLGEWGLPYASDPAVTRHLAAFLRRHGSEGAPARPGAVLFNGGVLKARAIAERLIDVLAAWGGARPAVLANAAPDLAVARGAAHYGLVRRGRGVRIRGGTARAYYLEVAGASSEREAQDRLTAVCVAPRGMEEGRDIEIAAVPASASGAAAASLALLVGRPARFRVLASSTRASDAPGEIVRIAPDEAELLPPVYTVLRPSRPAPSATVPVRLRARTSELGTLELWCVAPDLPWGEEKWRLQFDLRAGTREEEARAAAPAEGAAAANVPAAEGLGDLPPERIEEARRVVRALFARPGEEAPGVEPVVPATVMKRLEGALGRPRNEIPVPALRALWEPLRDARGERGRSAEHEARWLNLAGFVLRPGFGYALDDWRLRDLWRVWSTPPVHEKAVAVRLQWWILWRRVAGGLRRTQQDELGKRILPQLLPASAKGHRKPAPVEELEEMWRAAGSLEHLPATTKARLGDVLLARIEKGKGGPFACWTLGRLGARMPLYARVENAVPREVAAGWVERLLASGARGASDELAFALVQLARRSGDRVRDLDDPLRHRVAARLAELRAGERLALLLEEPRALEASETRLAFGDALPVGLVLVPAADAGEGDTAEAGGAA